MLIQFELGEARHKIEVVAVKTGNGLLASITGGDLPHIGAVALAVPRPSLSGDGSISATTSVLTITGHKDDEIARPAADKLARALNEPVIAVAGVHVGPPETYIASQSDIAQVVKNCQEAIEELIRRLRTPT